MSFPTSVFLPTVTTDSGTITSLLLAVRHSQNICSYPRFKKSLWFQFSNLMIITGTENTKQDKKWVIPFSFISINFLPAARYDLVPVIFFISKYKLVLWLPLIFFFMKLITAFESIIWWGNNMFSLSLSLPSYIHNTHTCVHKLLPSVFWFNH